MSYQIQNDESLGHSLTRVFTQQIDAAIAVAKGEKESDDTPVHQIRKHLKKARAVLRLVRKEIGRGLFREQDRALREVGRLVSDVRDAEVRLETVRELQGLGRKRRRTDYRSFEMALTLELENFLIAFADWQNQVLPMLEGARAATERWTLHHFGARQLHRSVQLTYKCARKALAQANADPKPKNYHRFRKEAKTLWYQLRLLEPVNSVVIDALTDELRAMGDLLGRAHDLSFLGERISVEEGGTEWRPEGDHLLAVIEVSQQDLQRGAADLADHFFAERPRDFGARVAGWLQEWNHSDTKSVAAALVQ